MIKITVTIEADTEENLRTGLREAQRMGLPVASGHVQSPAPAALPPAHEGADPPAGGSSAKEKLKGALSPRDYEFLVEVIGVLDQPARRVRLQEQFPGKGRSRFGKFLDRVETVAKKVGLPTEDVLEVRDNGLRGASREVTIGPGPILREGEEQSVKGKKD